MPNRRNMFFCGSVFSVAALAASLFALSLPPRPSEPPPKPAAIDPAIATSPDAAVIIQARPGRIEQARSAAIEVGARIDAPLPIVHGFAARLSGPAASSLATSTDILAVTLDRPGVFQATDMGDTVDSTKTVESSFTAATGATRAWEQGLRGGGVTVAVLDTGISPMTDLAPRVIHGPDLSGEGTPVDTYGHGTVMAGIIGGSGSDSAGRRTGVAPESRLVAVKVAGRNGVVDVSTVLQGMSWVSAYREQLGIKVLNLSYGTRSTQHPSIDPLNYAVQRLWKEGIVVVVAAGNDGPGTITKPGDDPVALTVGAYDDRGDTVQRNDVVPAWSSLGPTAHGVAKPDLVAPGRTLVSSRSYGSTVEDENPSSLVTPSYIKGSGTSQAAAVTSGLAALVLQARPTWTPDQVKQALTSSASPLITTSSTTTAGRPQVLAAINANPGAPFRQAITATGLGSIEASRGGMNVNSQCGQIVGEIDVFCRTWDGAAWVGNAWTGNAWTGNAWTGNAWTGNAWTGNAWTGNAWTGNAWTGNAWTGNAWTGNAWTGNAWTGNAWTGNAWTSTAGASRGTMTAFWGDRPKPGLAVAGERASTASTASTGSHRPSR